MPGNRNYTKPELEGMTFPEILAIVREMKLKGHSGLRKSAMIDFLLEGQARARANVDRDEKIAAVKRARAAVKKAKGIPEPEKTVRERYDEFVKDKTAAQRKALLERVLYYTGKGRGGALGHALTIDEARRVVMGEIPKPRGKRTKAAAVLEEVKGAEDAKRAKQAVVGELKSVKRTLDELDMYGPDPFFPDQDEINEKAEQRAKAAMDIYSGEFAQSEYGGVPVASQIEAAMSREPQSFTRSRGPVNITLRMPNGAVVSAGQLQDMRNAVMRADLASGRVVPRPPPGPPPAFLRR